jgi:hypothetical protein
MLECRVLLANNDGAMQRGRLTPSRATPPESCGVDLLGVKRMANLASVVWQDATHALLLALHGREAPSEAEWLEYCNAIPGVLAHPNGFGMVLTDGGAPTSTQRDRMRKRDGGTSRRNAVITDKAVVRGVVTAVSWFNPKIRAFAPREFLGACEFLGLQGAQIASVCAAFQQLDLALSARSRVLAEALKHVAAGDTWRSSQPV